jgi:hypothetical protein
MVRELGLSHGTDGDKKYSFCVVSLNLLKFSFYFGMGFSSQVRFYVVDKRMLFCLMEVEVVVKKTFGALCCKAV